MIFNTKQPHNQCVTFRTEPNALARLKEEVESDKNSLSHIINNKLRNAFNILFSAIKEKKENG